MHRHSAPKTDHAQAPLDGRRGFTAKIFRWLAQVNADRELPPSAAKIAIALAAYFNHQREGGMAWPGFETLARDAGLSKSVVVSVLRLMAERGHLKIEAGRPGRGHSSRYWMIEKGRQADLFEPEKRSAAPSEKGRLAAQKRSAGRPDSSKNHLLHGAEAGAVEEGERADALARVEYSPCDAGAPEGAREELKQESKPPPSEESPPPGEIATPFDQLKAIWRRPWCDDEAAERRAFERARREVAPETIIAAAQAHVAAADHPRFLQPLDCWLDRRGWEHNPPERKPRRASPSRRGGRTMSRSESIFAYMGERSQGAGL
jgi:hypothetical protein